MYVSCFSDEIPSHQESVRQMRENVEFTRYVVTVALQKIQQITDRGQCDGAEGHDQKKIFAYISQLARYSHYRVKNTQRFSVKYGGVLNLGLF